MSKFVLDTDIVTDVESKILNYSNELYDLSVVVNSYDVSDALEFDFFKAINTISLNIYAASNKMKNTATLLNKVVTAHTELQNSFTVESSYSIDSTNTNPNEYVLRLGDSLTDIAKKYGVSVESILLANSLTSDVILDPGYKLKIPSISNKQEESLKDQASNKTNPNEYILKSGDSLMSVASKYGISLKALLAANSLSADSILNPGEKIIIPSSPVPSNVTIPDNANTNNNQGTSATFTEGGLSNPCASYVRISSKFGSRNAPTAGASTSHKGIDMAAPSGASITAAAGGTVITAKYNSARGYYIEIDHGNGYVTLYQHCSSIDVKVGQTVSTGEHIAKVGSTGVSTGPHLHFEVHKDGKIQNPLYYLPTSVK